MRNLLDPAPPILYENVVLAGAENTRVGLLTVYPPSEQVKFLRNIWKIKKGDIFQRNGSETSRENVEAMPVIGLQEELLALESKAAASLETILRDVVKFHTDTPIEYQPRLLVFHDRHTVCYSGYPETESIESESWVILAGEDVELFWGALRYVKFANTEDSFSVIEHIPLFWKEKRLLVPFEETKFQFLPDGRYFQERYFVFVPPSVPKSEIDELLASYHKDLTTYRSKAYKLQDKFPRFEIYGHELLVAAVNGDTTARQYLLEYLDGHVDGSVGESLNEAIDFLNRIDSA